MTGPIFVISGVLGIGKTSVSTALMGRFPLGIHIPVDDIRAWVVSGYADPTRLWTEETERQFALARMEAAVMARRYSEAGFAVAIDDVIWPAEVDRYITPRTGDRPLHRVLLHAPLDVILRRNTMRTNKNFDTSGLEETIRRLHANLDPSPGLWPGWTILNTARMTLDATVEAILSGRKSD